MSSTSFEPNTALAPQAFADPGAGALTFGSPGIIENKYDSGDNKRHVNVPFSATNESGNAQKFFLIGVDSAGLEDAIAGTPFYDLLDFNGDPVSDSAGLAASAARTDLANVSNNFRSGIDTSNLDAGSLTLLNFGYEVHSTTTNSYDAIAAGAEGSVNFSTSYTPVNAQDNPGTGDIGSYFMRFAIVTETP